MVAVNIVQNKCKLKTSVTEGELFIDKDFLLYAHFWVPERKTLFLGVSTNPLYTYLLKTYDTDEAGMKDYPIRGHIEAFYCGANTEETIENFLNHINEEKKEKYILYWQVGYIEGGKYIVTSAFDTPLEVKTKQTFYINEEKKEIYINEEKKEYILSWPVGYIIEGGKSIT